MDQKGLEKIKDNYRKEIPEKLQNIERLITALKQEKTIESLMGLRLAIHKLAGNAGTFGFSEVSEHCKKLEILLISLLEPFESDKINEAFFSYLDEFLKQINKEFNHG